MLSAAKRVSRSLVSSPIILCVYSELEARSNKRSQVGDWDVHVALRQGWVKRQTHTQIQTCEYLGDGTRGSHRNLTYRLAWDRSRPGESRSWLDCLARFATSQAGNPLQVPTAPNFRWPEIRWEGYLSYFLVFHRPVPHMTYWEQLLPHINRYMHSANNTKLSSHRL